MIVQKGINESQKERERERREHEIYTYAYVISPTRDCGLSY